MSSFFFMIAMAISTTGFGMHEAKCSVDDAAPVSAKQVCEIFQDEFQQALLKNKNTDNLLFDKGREFGIELSAPQGPKITGNISWKIAGSSSAKAIKGEQVQNITMDKAIDVQSYRSLIRELIRINWKHLSK